MRKIHRKYENPIDNIILDVGDKVLPLFKKTGHTPNMLTTYSFLFGIVSACFLYYNKLFYFAISFYMSYIFDCWDGQMARKYAMTSRFGDLYDHITDLIVGGSVAYVVYKKYKSKLTFCIIASIVVMTYLMEMHIGCQQKLYTTSEPETIDIMECLCSSPKDITWTKYFAPPTFVLFVIVLIYYLNSR
jgi:phosphatidylglycerophosphate synthase